MSNNHQDLIFNFHIKRIIKELGVANHIVLATSSGDDVTARMVSVVTIDNKLYFQTDKTLRKYNQIMNVPKVALCINNFQIECSCTELGHPLDNELFCEIYKEKFPASYRNYSHLSNEVLFVCEPIFIKKWVYEEGCPYQEILDIANKKYFKERYIGE